MQHKIISIIILIACLTGFLSNFAVAQTSKASAQKYENLTAITDTSIQLMEGKPGMEYWIMRNVKGHLMAQGTKFQGRKHGVWREYMNGNGILTKLEEYEMGRKNGCFLSFSILGQVTIDETFRNDTLQGQRTQFLNNGRIKTIEHYVNGIVEGEKKSYYENTSLQEETYLKNGIRDGLTRWFYMNGNPSLEYTYKMGTLEGAAKEFGEDGQLKREGFYKNNEQDGEWKEFENGILVKKIYFKDGKQIREVPVKK